MIEWVYMTINWAVEREVARFLGEKISYLRGGLHGEYEVRTFIELYSPNETV